MPEAEGTTPIDPIKPHQIPTTELKPLEQRQANLLAYLDPKLKDVERVIAYLRANEQNPGIPQTELLRNIATDQERLARLSIIQTDVRNGKLASIQPLLVRDYVEHVKFGDPHTYSPDFRQQKTDEVWAAETKQLRQLLTDSESPLTDAQLEGMTREFMRSKGPLEAWTQVLFGPPHSNYPPVPERI